MIETEIAGEVPVKHWSIDRRIPLALIVTLLMQFGGFIWWFSSVESRLTMKEQRLTRVEQRLDALARQALTAGALALLGLRIDVLRLHAQVLEMGDALCCGAGIVAISHGVSAFLPGTARE